MGTQCCTTSGNKPNLKGSGIFLKTAGVMDKINALPVTGNDSTKALRKLNFDQPHVIKRPTNDDLIFDSSDEDAEAENN